MDKDMKVHLDNRAEEHTPHFSVIVALFNSELTVSATLDSFDSQTLQQGEMEYLIVNDGSDDRSLEIALRWAERRRNVVVVSTPNSGIASTRNVALSMARGTWVTSVDPDDIVERRYFSEVLKMMALDKDQRVALFSTRVLITKNENGKFNSKHPLDRKFKSGNRFVDLRDEPNAFAIGATTFLRRQILTTANLRFDERIAPSFEDGNLILKYLARCSEPVLGIVASAHYMYRKVEGGSSAVQGGWGRAEKYIDQVRWGYLGALAYARHHLGHTPDWLALAVCYDLMYYFKEYTKYNSKTRWVGDETGEAFLGYCYQIFEFISIDQLRLLELNSPNWNLLQTLRIAFGGDQSPGRLYRWGRRPDGRFNFTAMYRTGSENLQLFSNGSPVSVRVEGQKTHAYFGRPLVEEIVFSLPEGDAALIVDGMLCPQGEGEKPNRTEPNLVNKKQLAEMTKLARRNAFEWSKGDRRVERVRVESSILQVHPVKILARKLLARLKPSKRVPSAKLSQFKTAVQIPSGFSADFNYEGCWYFLDHPDRADDNAEHLYRHVLQHHPEINAVFGLEQTSPDWERLERDGFKLVDYGSPESTAAALAADVVLSSDAVEACMYPAPRKIFGPAKHKFVFLQHGISEKDISSWLRGKKIDLCICSTIDEFNAFAWKDSPYEFKESQLALTGFPRHDALLRKSLARRGSQIVGVRTPKLLVIPTWRRDLKAMIDAAPNSESANEVFKTSQFGVAWWQFLEDPRLLEEIKAGKLNVDFLLHPNFGDGLTGVNAPEGVRFLQHGEKPFQEMLLDCDLFMTDYSSLVFEVAYLGKPASYFQFDKETLGSGSHSWVPGYFNYHTMGLGPVHHSSEAAADWVLSMIDSNCEVDPEFAVRADRTFYKRDDSNSARVVSAVRSMLDGRARSVPDQLPDRAQLPVYGASSWSDWEATSG
ncbi:CDP-glycerol glycerophosphotransferase family protein [Leucobacter sp. NPDC015123]|uniref:bifunctional glycosyltransferase/CDP-glycerol:glycerophosphate glycerophosphotransferase n=1 Tax=Leucobacter sp. NPDC015123 TaxID=3364129 RepID=UPI0036F458AD